MSAIRQDPTTREWVIVAPTRARRPHTPPAAAPAAPPPEAACPFCPGNEASTPPGLLRLPGPGGGGWAVRVIPNKFGALAPGGELVRRECAPLFREMDGVGHHEVIVETPRHDGTMPRMTDAEVELVLRAYQTRYKALRGDGRVKYIIIFKNHGERAGTSLSHPHSQLVATPVPPMQMRRKYEVATAHFDDTGRCLYRDLVEAELEAKDRLVLQTDRFVVFHPYASRAPFETWIAPKRHEPSFVQVSAEDLVGLARVLRRTLATLGAVLGEHDFNYILHSAPVEDEAKHYYLWHIQILPRLQTIAGFELGSGIFITTMAPEESASLVRGALARGAGGR
ncbi:MAG TPA: galactose-1-phosphate uridylyltransferase [Candidatus Rokubacteria bacterium]|nr:MAG: galactose-1-phosphate uridylyltransferase [Candidatus Rokubacteria bacterium GWC2_70_16]HBH00907.1 galactose-1-phosphate uridylyltransferase [Candidatus Rokubacteria bacterium]